MWKLMIVIFVLLLFLFAPVNAQNVYLGPQIGYQKATDADEGNLMGGIAWRFRLTPSFGLEASINYRQETYANDVLIVRNWPVMVTGLVYPFPGVYGAMGIGWYNTKYDYDQTKLPLINDETTQEFGWHFGGGVELPISKKYILTGDVRYVFLNYNFNEIPGTGELENNFYIISIGILYDL